MKSCLYLFILGLALGCGVINCQLDITNCEEYKNKTDKCLEDYKVEGITPTQNTVRAFYLEDADIYCSNANKENFISSLKCIVDAERDCFTGDFLSLVPTSTQVQEAVESFCTRKADYNATCILETFKTMNVTTPASSASFTVLKTYFCGLTDLYTTNIGTELNNCPQTKEIFLDMVNKLSPPACSGAMVVYTTFVLLASLVMSLFY